VKASTQGHYVLNYNGVMDPDASEVQRVMAQFKALKCEEVLPGTIRVTGNRQEIESIAKALEDWLLSEEGRLTANPPLPALDN
jgi:hypothetical protein